MSGNTPATYSDLIEAIYSAALNPASYVDFMEMRENRIMQPWVKGEKPTPDWSMDSTQLAAHFKQALEIFEVKRIA